MLGLHAMSITYTSLECSSEDVRWRWQGYGYGFEGVSRILRVEELSGELIKIQDKQTGIISSHQRARIDSGDAYELTNHPLVGVATQQKLQVGVQASVSECHDVLKGIRFGRWFQYSEVVVADSMPHQQVAMRGTKTYSFRQRREVGFGFVGKSRALQWQVIHFSRKMPALVVPLDCHDVGLGQQSTADFDISVAVNDISNRADMVELDRGEEIQPSSEEMIFPVDVSKDTQARNKGGAHIGLEHSKGQDRCVPRFESEATLK